MPIRVGEFETVVYGLASEHIAEVMLGIDRLTQNGVVWVFDESRVFVGKESCDLYPRPGEGRWCRGVLLEGDTAVRRDLR